MTGFKRTAAIISLVLIVIAGAGLYFGLVYPWTFVEPKPVYYATRTIQASLVGSDGETHSLDARFVVDIEESAAEFDREALEERIKEIVAGLDFDKLTGYNGTLYAKEEILSGISDIIPKDSLNGIYIHDIASDFELPRDEDESARDEVYKALFPNMK